MYMESRIKELLKEKGITISDLADKIGTTQTSLSRALGENGNPTYETLNKISKALNVDMSELFKSKGIIITCPNCGKNINIKVELQRTGLILVGSDAMRITPFFIVSISL